MIDFSICMICGKPMPNDWDPQMCCSGYKCGCMGLPTEPPLCSNNCGQLWTYNNFHEYRHMWG